MATRKSAARDFLLYVVIGLAMVAATWLYAGYQARNRLEPGLPLNWLGFAAMTALVFGDAIRTTRRASRKGRFWLLLVAAFAIQVGIAALALWNAPRMSTMVWAVFIPLDAFALGAFLQCFLRSTPD